MKRIESSGLPTIFDSKVRQKSSLRFIELTLKATGSRALFPLACISLVAEEERSGCDVYYGDCDSYVAVRESYDDVKRLLMEASG